MSDHSIHYVKTMKHPSLPPILWLGCFKLLFILQLCFVFKNHSISEYFGLIQPGTGLIFNYSKEGETSIRAVLSYLGITTSEK